MFYKEKNFFYDEKKNFFESPKSRTHAFGQKMPNFSLFVFGQNKIRNKV